MEIGGLWWPFLLAAIAVLAGIEGSSGVNVGEMSGELSVLGPVEKVVQLVEVCGQYWARDLKEESLDHLSFTQLLHTALPHL